MARPWTTVVSEDVDPKYVSIITGSFNGVGVSGSIPEDYSTKDFYSNERGHVTSHLSVHPVIANIYGGLRGGAVAAIAERVAIACAKTVTAEDKKIFLGELGISYLSAAPKNEELIVDGSIVRSGKNVTVITIELKFKKTGKLAFLSRATFYSMPVAKLRTFPGQQIQIFIGT